MEKPHKPLSRTAGKRLFNGTKAAIHQMDGAHQRLAVEQAQLSQKYANALAIIEAMVRRHGVQVFDRGLVQSVCARGNVTFEVTADRITVGLRPTPSVVENIGDAAPFIDTTEEPV
jgi:hypothetical protein